MDQSNTSVDRWTVVKATGFLISMFALIINCEQPDLKVVL